MRNPIRKITTVVVLLLSVLLSPLSLAAQTAPTDWSRLNALTSEAKLSVKLKDGKKVEGHFAAVSDTALSLTVKNARKEVRREDVATIHEVSGKSAATAALIGMGVGAGTGAVLGVAADSDDDPFELHNGITAGLAVVGAGVGALAGFLVGKATKKRMLVYVSK
jgi:hypothetical protein